MNRRLVLSPVRSLNNRVANVSENVSRPIAFTPNYGSLVFPASGKSSVLDFNTLSPLTHLSGDDHEYTAKPACVPHSHRTQLPRERIMQVGRLGRGLNFRRRLNQLGEPLGGGRRLLLSVSLLSSMNLPDDFENSWAQKLTFEYGLIYSPLLRLILQSDIFSPKFPTG